MSKVSVIITTYNQAPFVTQAIESVLAQTFRDFEIIVIDDESSDDTPESLAGYLDSITYIRRPHQGIMAARVAGMQASKGALLSFMQADDLMPPQKLGLQVQQLEARPGLGLAYFGGQVWDGHATQIIREVESNRQGHLDSTLVALELFWGGCPLIRRDCVERAGLLEAPLSPDNDWNPWQRISLAGYEIDPKEQLVLCKAHLSIFLRKLHKGDIRAAQRHLAEAVNLSPAILAESEIFVDAVFDYAKRPDVNDPVAFAQTVLANLPDCARKLERLRPRILAELCISRAFQSYTLGNMAEVRQGVVAGLSYDLSYLRNRGIISIFCKSLLNRNGKLDFAGHGNKEFDVLPLVIENVQKASGQSVDSVEHTIGGTHRNTYMVRSGGRPFILRLAEGQSDVLTLSQVIAVTERVRAVGVPAPPILAYNCPAPDTAEPAWTLEEWVPGHPFIPPNMRWRDALSISTELGQCLRRLHSIETRGFGAISSGRLEAAHQTFGQWLDVHILDNPRTRTMLPAEALPLIEAACQFLRESYLDSPRLCHLDLHPWNFRIDNGHLSAVIDWEGVYSCDPAFNVASFHFWIDDEQILTNLLQAYAPDEPEIFWRRVMAGVICYAAYLLTIIDLQPTIDKQEVYHRCLRWLTDCRTYRLGRSDCSGSGQSF